MIGKLVKYNKYLVRYKGCLKGRILYFERYWTDWKSIHKYYFSIAGQPDADLLEFQPGEFLIIKEL